MTGGAGAYLREPHAIYARSQGLAEAATELGDTPEDMRGLALRLVHASGDPTVVAALRWSPGAAAAGVAALRAGAAVLTDRESPPGSPGGFVFQSTS